MASVGGMQMEVQDGSPATVTFTEDVCQWLGLDRDTTPEFGDILQFVHPEDEQRFVGAIQEAIDTAGMFDVEVRARNPDEEWLWTRAIGTATEDDGDVVSLDGAVQEIDDQKRHELALESLHEATRGLLGTDSETAIAELVVAITTDTLDVPGVAVYLIDSQTSAFEPVAATDAYRSLVDGPSSIPLGDGDTAIWRAFESGPVTIHDDDDDHPQAPFVEPDTAGLALPIGNYGVFVAAGRDRPVDESTRQLLETLLATTEAAFDRLESEKELHERDAELEAQNERLRRQLTINDLIRSVNRSLVSAGTREEVESAVCDRLVADDAIEFAWIADTTEPGDGIEASTWAGTNPEYLDSGALSESEASVEPALQTLRSGTATLVSNVLEDVQGSSWRRQTLAQGYQSVVAVPLAYDEYSYGVLAVYANESGAFGELERSVFEELGETIANSFTAIETRRALHTDSTLELRLTLTEPEEFLYRLARETDCRVTYEALASDSVEHTRLFISVAGAPADRIEDSLSTMVSVTESSLLEETEDGALFGVTVTGGVLAAQLVRHGGSPLSIVADADGLEATVDLPVETRVREFLTMIEEQFGAVELVSRRTAERELKTGQEYVSAMLDSLTERQQEVLRTAYFSGYFEWPRVSTGQDVAELLGVSQPTVNRHLRLGQGRLLAELFERTEGSADA
jgi:GAF domain-containing protein